MTLVTVVDFTNVGYLTVETLSTKMIHDINKYSMVLNKREFLRNFPTARTF